MSSASTPSSSTELIFLGTGTSSSIPHLDCLTAPPNKRPCKTCLSTLAPEGKHNVRRNTSAVLRVPAKDGQKLTVIIDVGKNFQAAACEWFPKYGLRRIDAVIITHAHADAMNGLDDLRGWTLGGAIQKHVDVYVSQSTFKEVQRAFPYLVSKEFASGGGDVPEFIWHIFEDKVPFEIGDSGISVTPISVHHGRLFSTSSTPPPAFTPTPADSQPGTPADSEQTSPTSPVRPLPELRVNGVKSKIHPLIAFGFIIQQSIVYISDVSLIPDDTWAVIEREVTSKSVFVVDCLRLDAHTSHYGIRESLATIRRFGAARNYMTGFSHDITHDEYVTMGKAAGGDQFREEELTATERKGVEMIKDGAPVWVRPAHDGLRVLVSSEGGVEDDTYGR